MIRHPASEHTEIEAKLVVLPAGRREVVSGLRDLHALGGSRLIERPPRDQHDRYFDTADGDLGRHDLSFRLRSADGRMVLTVKGPTEYLPGGALARLEVEEAWSDRALVEILGKLRGWGMPLRDVAVDADMAPEVALEAAGLVGIHRRLVRRIVRDVVPDDDPAKGPVAEVVFDAVEFEVGERRVRHDEIEVEGRGPSAAAHVGAITSDLVARFGDALRPWRPSKLALGLALDALEREGALDPLVDGEGRLTADGYETITRRLGEG